MSNYLIPKPTIRPKLKNKQVYLVANGDLRLSANQMCWPAQKKMEQTLASAVADAGYQLIRAHPYKPKEKHGFIGSQKEGMAIFADMDPIAPVIVAEAVWRAGEKVTTTEPIRWPNPEKAEKAKEGWPNLVIRDETLP